ncbi:MAG: zinc-ribbon domain-containing protein [Candidatus Berkelbacteria bacterium]|nr:zinc-ribbon domain-containing protein [Candidatus Berkelbacteria bacterium]
MELTDKVLVCKDCGDKFIWTEGEQKFFIDKGLKNIPKRCKSCSAVYKAQLNEKHPQHWITCKICKKKAEVPFEPKSDDILCEDCFHSELKKRNDLILASGEKLPE